MAVHPIDGEVWGALYGSAAMRAVFDERAWLARMLEVEAALALAEAELGLIPAEAAARIAEVAARPEALDFGELPERTRRVGYPVVGLVAALSKAAGPEAGRYTHWGATTQDILDTALVLQLREALGLLARDLGRLIQALAALAARHRRTPMAGRTHLQHALPITFGLKCAVWLDPLLRHAERLAALRPRVLVLSFGGAAGTLASLGAEGLAIAERLAARLGLGLPPLPWHVSRDSLNEAVAWLGLLTGSLGKMATDVMLLSQTELGEVSEPHLPGRGSSSTMPQKRNPIAAEYILAQARAVHGLVPVMMGAMMQDFERGTGNWQAEPLAVGPAFVLAHGALEQAIGIAEGIVVDEAQMRRNLGASGGLIMAEAVMMRLAPALGREAAHHVVQEACDLARAEGIPLAAALARRPEVAVRFDDATLREMTDPLSYLGSAEAFIDRVLERARPFLGGGAGGSSPAQA
jgi:3-carboxy-cis,cis-muconate cycloisomerase